MVNSYKVQMESSAMFVQIPVFIRSSKKMKWRATSIMELPYNQNDMHLQQTRVVFFSPRYIFFASPYMSWLLKSEETIQQSIMVDLFTYH